MSSTILAPERATLAPGHRFGRISSDTHMDLICLPADLFTSAATTDMKARMPYVATDAQGVRRWTAQNGARLGMVGGVGVLGEPYKPGANVRLDLMEATGYYTDSMNGVQRAADPHLRSRDMDIDGVDAAVIYGILGVSGRIADPPAAKQMLRIYNDWMADFCKHDPKRHIGLACMPHGDVEAAAAEVRRAAKLGFRGVELSCAWDMDPMWHPGWEPLWQALDETGLPVHFHTFPSLDFEKRHQFSQATSRAIFFTGVCVFQMHLAHLISGIIGSGVLERHRNIRLVFGESGIGWIPYLLDRMDFEWEDRFGDLNLRMKPSEYWKERCYATYQIDPIGMKLLDEVGIGSILWGSDYPHPDGVWPQSVKSIAQQLRHASDDVVHQIVYANAARLYGFLPRPA